MPKRIPIKAAKDFAADQHCTQVIIVAWDGAQTHVVTYGVTKKDCTEAAMGGNLLKKAMGWPEELCNAMPSRSRIPALSVSNVEMLAILNDIANELYGKPFSKLETNSAISVSVLAKKALSNLPIRLP